MIGDKYLRLRSKSVIFDYLRDGEKLYGILLEDRGPEFEPGVYELQELEVWRIHRLLEYPEVLVFAETMV